MTTDADGSHFDARAQFRGLFAVTWNDVANGPQRGPRVLVWGRGRITAHWANEQIRRDVLVDYVREAPAHVGPQISALRNARAATGQEERTVVVSRLIFDIGPLELPS